MFRNGGLVALLLAGALVVGPAAAGGFDVVLRTYQEPATDLHEAFLRLEAAESYPNYHWRVDAGAGDEAAAGFVRVREIGSGLLAPEVACQGPVAVAAGVHVHLPCDDLRVLHHYELTWTVNDPAAVLTLRAL